MRRSELKRILKSLGIRRGNRNYAIVTEVIIDVLELETWNEFVEECSAFVDLSFNKLGVSTGLERLAVPILLVTLDS
jgi:hypothetical protein